VPSYQQGRFLERCLASIRGQRDVEVQLIVMDACSTDETAAVLARWRPRIDHLVIERDDGQADAIASGLERATAPVVTWLNSDDLYAGADALRTLVDALHRSPDVDLVYGRRLWIDADGVFLAVDTWHPFDADVLRQACYLPQESAVFRRETYERVGGIDRSFSFAIDYDLWLRLLDHGSNFLSIPAVVGMFRRHADQKTTAQWQNVGLVEIARLHRRHLRREIPEAEMIAVYDDYRDGVAGGDATAVRTLRRDVVAILNGHLANRLQARPIDRWAEE
jgi:glycosyltransferase involved in cell wall biosynthesis